MPKIIELTFELNINKVSCPGVWLCQDGQVSLTVFALGSSYETCMLPPVFPLMFKDVFYFRKRFQAACTLSNIFCLLKDETVYCELIQWGGDCRNDRCTVLAQYLGALNDVLFPPDLCSNEGVDLLMRRSKGFPGILAPKIEISTKVRLDEVFDALCTVPNRTPRVKPCGCRKADHEVRQHSRRRPHSAGSCCSDKPEPPAPKCGLAGCGPATTACHAQVSRSRSRTSLSDKQKERCRECNNNYQVYNVATPNVETTWQAAAKKSSSEDLSKYDCDLRTSQDRLSVKSSPNKVLLESRFIEPEPCECHQEPLYDFKKPHKKIAACTCEICKRYYELFHQDSVS
ncbi:spermatogenesis-assoc protein 6 domain-containing protein [Phthorimaea operculella]|nr:spermatogenesis-assoc protein 6 domain-containing protein [Phthorimaea operculella]